MKAVFAVTLFAALAVVATNAQYIPWADPFRNKQAEVNSTRVVVPKCGSNKSQCYEQTKGQPNVEITGYAVTSDTFPCTGGQSATALDFNLKVAMQDGTCNVYCDGFGCSNDNTIKVCSDAFGFPQCPQPAGQVSVVGKSGECSSGFGDYKITIACPQFEFVTYLTY